MFLGVPMLKNLKIRRKNKMKKLYVSYMYQTKEIPFAGGAMWIENPTVSIPKTEADINMITKIIIDTLNKYGFENVMRVSIMGVFEIND